MKLIYLTSKKYPGGTADHIFVKEMANAFGKVLRDDFLLILANNISEFFKDIHIVNVGLNNERGRTVYYFFWLFFFIIKNKHNSCGTVFFSNDPNLLSSLIVLRKLFRFRYKICSEWHQLFDDWRDSFVATKSDFLIVTSRILRQAIVNKTKINPEKSFVVYGGVHIEKYNIDQNRNFKKELHLPHDKILVAYVGLFKTLGIKKGIDTMINALEYLPENIVMVFVGGTKEEIAEYQEQITNTKIFNRCVFIEKQSAETVSLYQKTVDILVIPNPDKPPFNNYCIPMKIYEYLASRKPIIYSKFALLDEVLCDCAFDFVPENPKDLAEKILFVVDINNRDAVKQKAVLCYTKAEQWTWEKRARRIVGFLTTEASSLTR